MIELTGLQVKDFIHPEESVAWNALMKATWLKRLLDWLGSYQARLELKTNLLGNTFGVTREDMPELYCMIREVCDVLDYRQPIQVYVYRSSDLDIKIYYGDTPVLIYPDFILNDYDRDMIRFETGRAVTMLKSDNAQLRVALWAAIPLVSGIPAVGEVAVPVLASWLRKADYTEDRGGLLACQNMGIAAKTLMRRCGLPTRYIDVSVLPAYLRTCKAASGLSGVSQAAQTLYRAAAWNNDRVTELYKWYSSGMYDDLVEAFE